MQNDLFLKNYTCMYTMYTVKQHIVLKFFYSHPFLGCSVQKRISIHASSQRRFRWSLVCQLWLFYRNVGYRGKKKRRGGPWRSVHRDDPSHTSHAHIRKLLVGDPPRQSKPHIACTHLQTSWGGESIIMTVQKHQPEIEVDALVNQLSSRLCSLFFGSWSHSRKYCPINKVCALAGIVNGTLFEASITISCEHFYFGNTFVMWVTLHIHSFAWWAR